MRRTLTCLAITAMASGAASADSAAEALAKLDRAEALWTHAEPTAYSFRIEFRGMYRPADCMEGFVAVVAAGLSKDQLGCESVRADYGTISALFRLIRNELSQAPEHVDLTFDESYGYPIAYYLDPRKDTYDDESGFSIHDFKTNSEETPPNTSLERTRER